MTNEERPDPATLVLTCLAELRGYKPDDWLEGQLFERTVRLDRCLALITVLRDAVDHLEQSLADSMEADDVPIDGVGVLHRSEERRWRWRYDGAGTKMREDLATAVAAEVALDVATGELDPMKRNVALHALNVAYTAIPAFSSLNKAGRERLGLSTFDYRIGETYYRVRLEVE